MGKRWAVGALLALSVIWVVSAAPLADARGRAAGGGAEQPVLPPESPAETRAEAQEGLLLEEIAEDAGSLTGLRTVEIGRAHV